MDITSLKNRLNELVENSDTINSLLPSEKEAYLEKISNSTPEKIQELIKVFEEELIEDAKIEEEFALGDDEIAEIKAKKSKQERVERQKKEIIERKKEQLLAENLLKKLDQIL